jgi:hypothetical protein
MIDGTLEPEELIEKLIIRHDERVAKQERIPHHKLWHSSCLIQH